MIEPDQVLAATRTTEYAPASNVRGVVAGATWRYLLPSMDVRRALLVGRIDAATTRALARTASEIVVVGRVPAGETGATVTAVAPPDASRWLDAREPASIDVAVVADAPVPVDRFDERLRRILAPGAVVLRERHGRPATLAPVTIAVRPDRGDIRSATAAGDDGSERVLAERNLLGPSIRLAGPRRLTRLVGRFARGRHRRLELSLPDGTATLPAAPTWLADVASADGVDLGGYRCSLSAVGDYNTQKVLLVLRRPTEAAPELIVKLTRDASVNRRLETERDALRALATLPDLTEGRVPRVRFAGRHAGLAVVGETALHGRPFGPRPGGPDVPALAEDALGWLTELGAATAREADPAAVADALAQLHERFVALCRPGPGEAGRLRDAIEVVRGSGRAVPLVLQHGDPGTWNLLVDDAGRVAFLDWENADQAGMPLWDLFYLLRSHAVGAARRAGVRRRLAGVERFLFGASPLSDSIVATVGGYASRLGLAQELVEPLFHLCWMHQALKEATRVEAGRVREGHYNRLLRLGLERRTAPTLARIFAGEGR